MVRPGRQVYLGTPDSVAALLHADGLLLPVREVTCQLHAHGCGGGKIECLRHRARVFVMLSRFHVVVSHFVAGRPWFQSPFNRR